MERYPALMAPALMAINMGRNEWSSHVQNRLIPRSDPPVLVLSPSTKVLWQSLIDLVVLNRERGYCISESITAENLLVSDVDGRFALRDTSATYLREYDSDFVGFEAARDLFMDLLVKQYGEGVIPLLSHDISHLLATLGNRSKDAVSAQHPALMSYEKCAELMIRIHELLTM